MHGWLLGNNFGGMGGADHYVQLTNFFGQDQLIF